MYAACSIPRDVFPIGPTLRYSAPKEVRHRAYDRYVVAVPAPKYHMRLSESLKYVHHDCPDCMPSQRAGQQRVISRVMRKSAHDRPRAVTPFTFGNNCSDRDNMIHGVERSDETNNPVDTPYAQERLVCNYAGGYEAHGKHLASISQIEPARTQRVLSIQ